MLAPVAFRRRAVGQLTTQIGVSSKVEFRHLQDVRLRVTLAITGDGPEAGRVVRGHNTWANEEDKEITPLEASLHAAQREIVEHELFAALVREAGTLPTASASVSEQLIVIEAAQGIELRFELVSQPNSHREAQRTYSVLLFIITSPFFHYGFPFFSPLLIDASHSFHRRIPTLHRRLLFFHYQPLFFNDRPRFFH
jgi:hypothetical protein